MSRDGEHVNPLVQPIKLVHTLVGLIHPVDSHLSKFQFTHTHISRTYLVWELGDLVLFDTSWLVQILAVGCWVLTKIDAIIGQTLFFSHLQAGCSPTFSLSVTDIKPWHDSKVICKDSSKPVHWMSDFLIVMTQAVGKVFLHTEIIIKKVLISV